MKCCKRCGEEKPLSEYFKSGKYYQSNCKPCHGQVNKKYVAKYLKSFKGKTAIKKHNTLKQGIYGIFSNNECLYVGESSWLNKRMEVHKSRIKNPYLSNQPKEIEMYIRIAEYDNVEIKVLEETTNHKERENYWIQVLRPKFNNMY